MKSRILIFFILLFSGQAIAQKDSIKGNEPVRYYFPNGTISSEGFIKNGKPDGYWKNYNEDGSLKSEGNRINGELDSIWIFYGLKSIPKSSIQFKVGKKQGLKKQFDEKGILVSVESFEFDSKQGWSYQYFPNGKTKYQVNFNSGKEEGRGLEFSEEDQIISLFDYKSGALMRQQRINRFDKLNKKTGYWIELYPDYSIKRENVRVRVKNTFESVVANQRIFMVSREI
jgi:antitoxin component YwqK of YwqJK toxin-antitoxin module